MLVHVTVAATTLVRRIEKATKVVAAAQEILGNETTELPTVQPGENPTEDNRRPDDYIMQLHQFFELR